MARTAPRRYALGVTAGVVAALLGLASAPAAAQVPPGEPRSGPDAAQLDARVAQLSADLAALDAALAEADAAAPGALQQVADARAALASAGQDDARARATLSRYAVGAYVGNDVTDALAVRSLTAWDGEVTDAGGRVLTATAHRELTRRARQAREEVVRRQAELDGAAARQADEDRRRRDDRERLGAIQADLVATRAAATRAHAVERARAEEEARRRAEDEAIARTPRPTSARTGVVPARSVRADIVARLGGQIPPTALDAYWRAARLADERAPGCAIDWALVAAIGRVESNHASYGGAVLGPDGSTEPVILGPRLDGRGGFARIRDTDGGALDGDPVYDRAVGPMQFIPSTWRAYESDGNGDGVADPHNLYDAALGAARYLCAAGRGPLDVVENASRAVYAYNRDAVYNAEVLTMADEYRRTIDPTRPPATPPPTVPVDPTDLPPPATPGKPPPAPPAPTTTSSTAPTTTTTTVPAGP